MGSWGQASAGALPPELLAAIDSALQREREEIDAEMRRRIQAGIRAAVDGWLRGRVTTPQAVLLLRITSEARRE